MLGSELLPTLEVNYSVTLKQFTKSACFDPTLGLDTRQVSTLEVKGEEDLSIWANH